MNYSLEDLGVLAKVANVKHLLRVVELVLALGVELRVETGGGAEIGDAARRRDTGAREHDDALGVGEEAHGVVDAAAVGQLLPATEDAREGNLGKAKEVDVGGARLTQVARLSGVSEE